jgi:hypothetical protein
MSPDATEVHVGRRLYDAGWKQGAILHSTALKFAYSKLASRGEGIEPGERPIRNRECLVVSSQDCDILSASEDYIEVLVCTKESAKFCARLVEGNSSRWFLVNEEMRFVAQAPYRLYIEKEALEQFEPENWSLEGDDLERFARWLARRYIRPAYPNEFVEVFQDPFNEVFDNAPEDIANDFSRVVREVRLSKSSIQGPPYNIDFVLLTLREDITEQELDAIEYMQETIYDALSTLPEIDDVAFSVRTLDEMSAAEYFATDPVYLEYLTREGEGYIRGAEPPPQT